jgi:hypothetical protein
MIILVADGLLITPFLRPDPASVFSWQPKNLEWWTVNTYRSLRERPCVVLIGSSLMAQISNEGDATYLEQRLDARIHHRSIHLESLIQNKFSRIIRTASLSIPGAHCSDVALLALNLFTPPRKPDLVVFGIAPRDLMDNTLSSPASTLTFRLMEKIGDIGELEFEGRPQPAERAELTANKVLGLVFPAYRFQNELSLGWLRSVDDILNSVIPNPGKVHPEELVALGFALPHQDLKVPFFSLPYSTSSNYKDDVSKLYRRIYNPFDETRYKLQLRFLTRFLTICKDRNIKVMLVNMPLRSDSYHLMPTAFYERYERDLKQASADNGAVFVDMHDSPRFRDTDFIDQVHLSGSAAGKFLTCLTDELPGAMGWSQSKKRRDVNSTKLANGARTH